MSEGPHVWLMIVVLDFGFQVLLKSPRAVRVLLFAVAIRRGSIHQHGAGLLVQGVWFDDADCGSWFRVPHRAGGLSHEVIQRQTPRQSLGRGCQMWERSPARECQSSRNSRRRGRGQKRRGASRGKRQPAATPAGIAPAGTPPSIQNIAHHLLHQSLALHE